MKRAASATHVVTHAGQIKGKVRSSNLCGPKEISERRPVRIVRMRPTRVSIGPRIIAAVAAHRTAVTNGAIPKSTILAGGCGATPAKSDESKERREHDDMQER